LSLLLQVAMGQILEKAGGQKKGGAVGSTPRAALRSALVTNRAYPAAPSVSLQRRCASPSPPGATETVLVFGGSDDDAGGWLARQSGVLEGETVLGLKSSAGIISPRPNLHPP